MGLLFDGKQKPPIKGGFKLVSKQSAGLSDTLAHQIVFHRRKKVRLTVWLITTCYGLFRYTTDTFCAVDPFSILAGYIIVCPVTPQVELFILRFCLSLMIGFGKDRGHSQHTNSKNENFLQHDFLQNSFSMRLLYLFFRAMHDFVKMSNLCWFVNVVLLMNILFLHILLCCAHIKCCSIYHLFIG